ncbi:hypothetical protein ASF53_05175 [Methylobacterium sp. Leaf123]|uniref:transcription termination/antitermination protein NusG n=1 Tax=Methylobacterium sp. Leaf123 TaxID=1736264 RepID=UPI0006FAFEA5|nr:hypothetical protein [Methylobacterium sp. Leaf123]KQQ23719.1 hypothetical protein ASF53_05175 [Methylobacterium sp. Leaf123]
MGNLHRRRGKREKERTRRQRRAAAKVTQRHRTAQAAAQSETKGSASDPVRGSAPLVIDPARHWHIARLLPRMGERATKELAKAEVTVFQPRTDRVIVIRGRRVVHSAQLLPRTIFIGVRDEVHLDEARQQQGVAEIVSRLEEEGGPEGNVSGMVLRPARLDPEALQRFADAVAKGEIVAPMGVSEGANVVVLTGPFASFPAVVEKILPGDRLKLGVSIFGRCTPIELGLAEVRLV